MASATADWRAAFLEAAAGVVVEEDVGADGACKKERRGEKISQAFVFTVRAH